jgi:hypothetical protein
VAQDDQSPTRTAAVVRAALGTLDRFRGRSSTTWDQLTDAQKATKRAYMAAAITGGTYTCVETDPEMKALEGVIVESLLAADIVVAP